MGSAGRDVGNWFDRVVNRPEVGEVGLDGLVDMALDQLAGTRSTWGRPDLVVAVGALVPPQSAHTGPEVATVIERLTDEALGDHRVVDLAPAIDFARPIPLRADGLPVDVAHDHARYSTVETIATELEVLDFATEPDAGCGEIDPDVVEAGLVDTEEPVAKTRF